MTTNILGRSIIFAFLAVTTVLSHSAAEQESKTVPKTAETYISEFRRGKDFNQNDSVGQIVVAGQLNLPAFLALTKELAVGSTPVRQNIVRLLEKVGLELDAPAPGKFAVIRDHSIIRALLVEGFSSNDSAADAAATVLIDKCMPSDLSRFGDIYARSLRLSNGEYLTLAAKAKTTDALELVEALALSPAWRNKPENIEAANIARAALGNTRIEDEFINAVKDAEKLATPAPPNRFYNVGLAKDGTEVAKRLYLLGRIGTKRSLVFICSYLRSPMKSYIPNVRERSVRYAALDALLYTFPDERVLSDPRGHADWSAAEQFCSDRVGAAFEGETPNIPPDQAYPTKILSRTTEPQVRD